VLIDFLYVQQQTNYSKLIKYHVKLITSLYMLYCSLKGRNKKVLSDIGSRSI